MIKEGKEFLTTKGSIPFRTNGLSNEEILINIANNINELMYEDGVST